MKEPKQKEFKISHTKFIDVAKLYIPGDYVHFSSRAYYDDNFIVICMVI